MGSVSNNKNDGDKIAVTDNGNYIVDLFFQEPIVDVAAAAKELKSTGLILIIVYFLFILFSYLHAPILSFSVSLSDTHTFNY